MAKRTLSPMDFTIAPIAVSQYTLMSKWRLAGMRYSCEFIYQPLQVEPIHIVSGQLPAGVGISEVLREVVRNMHLAVSIMWELPGDADC